MSSSSEARLAAWLGGLAIVAIPLAGAAAAYTSQVTLLKAVYVAVPVALVAAVVAVRAYRRARVGLERTVRRTGERVVRTARLLSFGGLYVAVTGVLALGFYGLLHLIS